MSRITTALSNRGLDFTIRSEPLFSRSGPVPHLVIRNNENDEVLGNPVTERYGLLSHRVAFEALDRVLPALEEEHGEAQITCQGSNGNAVARVLLRFPGSDHRLRSLDSNLYPTLLLTHGIGGIRGLTATCGLELAACANGLVWGENATTFSARHTGEITVRLDRMIQKIANTLESGEKVADLLNRADHYWLREEFEESVLHWVATGRRIEDQQRTSQVHEAMTQSLLHGAHNRRGRLSSILQAATNYTSHRTVAAERLDFTAPNIRAIHRRAAEFTERALKEGVTGAMVALQA